MGARQVGKSTLVRSIAETEHPATALSLDDTNVRAGAERDPPGIRGQRSHQQADFTDDQPTVSHFRDRDGSEIDLILEHSPGGSPQSSEGRPVGFDH